MNLLQGQLIHVVVLVVDQDLAWVVLLHVDTKVLRLVLVTKEKIGFEGGQMPLQRRIPKGGFKNINHKEYFAVNLSVLQELAENKNLTKVGLAELVDAGLTNGKKLVKILGNGELKAKLEVEAHAFSKTAEEAIKAVGGNTTII